MEKTGTFYARGGDPIDAGTLRPKVQNLVRRIEAALVDLHRDGSDADQGKARSYSGYMAGVEGFLLQAGRMRDHATSLRNSAKEVSSFIRTNGDEGTSSIAGIPALTDFESLLFHGRALLDRMTLVVSRSYQGNTDKFSKIRSALPNIAGGDERAGALLQLVDQADGLEGLLTDSTTGTSALRSLVAHKFSAIQRVTTHFNVVVLPSGKVLLFDCEVNDIAVLEASVLLNHHVAFLALNSVAIYLGLDTLTLSQFKPTWRSPALKFSASVPGSGLEVTVVRQMLPDGVELTTQRLKSEVVRKAHRP